jgi:protein xylosyltransferase
METSFGACRETMGGLWVVMSVISYQLPVTSYQLSVISYQLPVTSYQLSVTSYQLPVTSYQV